MLWTLSVENTVFIVYDHDDCMKIVTSEQVHAVSKAVLKTEIFYQRYLKIDNFCHQTMFSNEIVRFS